MASSIKGVVQPSGALPIRYSRDFATPSRPHAHRISPHPARRPRPQRRLSCGAAPRDRQGRDDGGRYRRGHRLPGLPGRQARAPSASISTRRPTSPSVARKLLRHNRLSNCRIAEMHSTEVCDPDRVDVVVSETLGNYPFEENIVETLNDARARFLKPGGIIIPRAVEQFVCPVVSERFLASWRRGTSVGFGLDFAPAKTMTLNNIYVRTFEADDLLETAPQRSPCGTSSPSTAATRRRAPAKRAGLSRSAPRSTAWRCGGRPSWSRASPCPPARSIPANALGAALPAGLGADRDRGRADADRAPALHHLLRARHQRDLDALPYDAKAGREVLRQALDLEKGFLP